MLDEWIWRASSSGVATLKTMAKTLSSYKSGILNYYDFPISTSRLQLALLVYRQVELRGYPAITISKS